MIVQEETVSVFVEHVPGLSDQALQQLEISFSNWGARRVVKYWRHYSAYHLHLETQISYAQFKKNATDVRVVSVDRVEELDYAAMPSSMRSVSIGSRTRLDAWWYQKLGLQHVQNQSAGEGVVVAMLDSGVSYHPELFLLDYRDVAPLDHADGLYDSSEFLSHCYGMWRQSQSDRQYALQTSLGVISQYGIWPALSSHPALDKLQTYFFDRSILSQAALGQMSPRLKTARGLHDLDLNDLSDFSQACGMGLADSLIDKILAEMFERDWPVKRTSYVDMFMRDRELMFSFLVTRWGLFERPFPRVIHPASGAIKGGSFFDLNGHGTNMAGILFSASSGVCPKAACLALPCGSTSAPNTADLIDALDEAGDRAAHIASVGFALAPHLSVAPIVTKAFKRAFDSGVLVVVPAGNYGKAGVSGFAPIANTVCVGSVTVTGMPVLENEVAPQVDVWSYGGGTDPSNAVRRPRNEYSDYPDHSRILATRVGGGFDFCSGASVAATQVAGVAALLQSLSGVRDPLGLRQRLFNCRDRSLVSPYAPPFLKATGILNAALI